MEKIGVSQKIIIFNGERKILALRRTKTAPHNPLKWDFPGGELDFGEDALEGIIREAKEEGGIEIEDLKPFDVESHITEDGKFWITVAYKAKAVSDKVSLSYEHDQFKWVSASEFLNLEAPDKLKRFVKNLDR